MAIKKTYLAPEELVFWQSSVIDKDLTTAPAANNGDHYIVAGTGGDWSGGVVKDIAWYVGGAWLFIQPMEGMSIYVDDENVMYDYNGSDWVSRGSAVGLKTTGLIFIIGGGGEVISTGLQEGRIYVPFDCEIEESILLAKPSGSIVIDIWKDTYANYEPTVADTITSAAKPTISGGIKDQDSTLTGWTKTITAGDVLAYNVDSVATCTECTSVLKVKKT